MIRLKFYICENDICIKKIRVDTLQINESLVINMKAKLNDFVSGNYIIGVVDASNIVIENDETNNIDYYEINTFMIKVGIPWRCRWPDKVIEYFSEVNEKNKGTLNHCIHWSTFKNYFRNNK